MQQYNTFYPVQFPSCTRVSSVFAIIYIVFYTFKGIINIKVNLVIDQLNDNAQFSAIYNVCRTTSIQFKLSFGFFA